MADIIVHHPNGFSGRLYGESSMSIFDSKGNECLHTGFRNVNTEEELYNNLENFPDFMKMIFSERVSK